MGTGYVKSGVRVRGQVLNGACQGDSTCTVQDLTPWYVVRIGTTPVKALRAMPGAPKKSDLGGSLRELRDRINPVPASLCEAEKAI